MRLKANAAHVSTVVVPKENDPANKNGYSFELVQSEVKPYSRIGSDEDENENDDDEQISDDEHLETAISRQSDHQQTVHSKRNDLKEPKEYCEGFDDDEGTFGCSWISSTSKNLINKFHRTKP